MLIDSHCHLDAAEFDTDRAQVLAAASRAGVEVIVLPAVERCNFEAVATLARDEPPVCFTLGIHPLYVDRAADDDLEVLGQVVRQCLGDPKFLGIGEIGLDYFVPGLDRERQSRFFERQLRLATELNLPVILHIRWAQDAVLKQLRRFRPGSGIAHAFNGSRQQADQYLDLGFALGFGGAMTFTRALQIRRLATELPLESIVLETDAPDIAPAWLRTGRNSPAELPGIARVLAQLRGIELQTCMDRTGENALRVLPRLADARGSRQALS